MKKGNKTWHTGTWKKKIQTVANGQAKEDAGNIEVQACVRYILDKREINTISISPPVKSVIFPPLRRILSTISMRQLLSFLLVSNDHIMIILILGPG